MNTLHMGVMILHMAESVGKNNNNIFLQPWRSYEMLHSNIFGKNEKYSPMCCQFEEHWHFNLKHFVNLNLTIYHKIFEPKNM